MVGFGLENICCLKNVVTIEFLVAKSKRTIILNAGKVHSKLEKTKDNILVNNALFYIFRCDEIFQTLEQHDGKITGKIFSSREGQIVLFFLIFSPICIILLFP